MCLAVINESDHSHLFDRKLHSILELKLKKCKALGALSAYMEIMVRFQKTDGYK